MRNVHERYLKGLMAIYEDCQKDGVLSNMTMYAKTYSITASIGTILQQLDYLEKIGAGRYASYKCKMRKPDQAMVIEVLDTLKEYAKGHSPALPPNIIPATDYKKKVETEVANVLKEKMQAELTDTFIRATYAAKILGIDLMGQPKQKINAFIKAWSEK